MELLIYRKNTMNIDDELFNMSFIPDNILQQYTSVYVLRVLQLHLLFRPLTHYKSYLDKQINRRSPNSLV